MLEVPVTLSIENARLKSVEESNTTVTFSISTTESSVHCRHCQCSINKSHCVNDERTVRHLPLFGKQTFIAYHPNRYLCVGCDHTPTTTYTPPWHNVKSAFTVEYEQHVLLSLINSTVADVSKKEKLSEESVNGILNRSLATEVDWSSFKFLGVMGMDEISLKKGYKHFVTVITSKHAGKITLIAVLKGRKKTTIKAFLRTIPKRLHSTIVAFCTDMYDGYVSAVKAIFKNKSLLIIDRFHVATLYRRAVDKFRQKILRQLKKELTDDEYSKIKNVMPVLRRSNECLTEQEKEKLSELFSHSSELTEAYRLALKLTQIYNTHMSKNEALIKINAWIKEVKRSRITCFGTFIKTLSKYKNEISNYFIDRNTSGFVEGLNNKIKVLKRRCYGIFNVNHLFQRLHLDISGYDIFLGNTTAYTTT